MYWVNINADIESTIKPCVICLEYKQKKPQEVAIAYEVPCKTWEVVDADIFLGENKTLVHY